MHNTAGPIVAGIHDGLLGRARALYRDRRLRREYFPNYDIFGEPAWDLLLDLFIAHLEHKTVSVTSACVASGVPVTTALRWLGNLAENGLVVRSPDPNDRRRMIVSLTPVAVDAMEAYLTHIDDGLMPPRGDDQTIEFPLDR